MRTWLLLGGFACAPSESAIREAIDEASYCDVAEDCANAGGQCPFGCDVLVNASEVEVIRDLMARYAERGAECLYDCAALVEIRCDAGTCVGDYGF
jgi:hypothetical protein